jgi:carbon-monoxide dehydrogenase medium subunit
MTYDYVCPQSVRELSALLAEYGGDAKVLAGGVKLVPLLRRRAVEPRVVVSLRRLGEVRGVSRVPGDGVLIGARTTLAEVEGTALPRSLAALDDGVRETGSVQIRNQASIGGNLCQADPFSDIAAPLIALGATLRVTSAAATRSLPVGDFFTGRETTALGPGEFLSHIAIDVADGATSAYAKFSLRQAADRALAGVAVWLRMDGRGCVEARVGVAGGGEIPVRARKAEAVLRGREVDDAVIAEAAAAAMSEVAPPTDFDATAEYRRQLVRVLCARATRQARERSARAPRPGEAR